jgi:hypothetical protein
MIPPYTPALIRKAARSMFSDSAVFSVNVDSAAQIMREPTTSYWLKNALETALDRDPVNAIADVEKLLSVLQSRWD